MKRLINQIWKKLKNDFNLNQGLGNRQILVIVVVICILLMCASLFANSSFTPLRIIANYTVVPFQKGINSIACWIGNGTDSLKTMDELVTENEELQEQVQTLTEENSKLQQDHYELERLQSLYGLEENYGNYVKIGARVIGRDSSNWFNMFTINKGSSDGVAVDMNVLASGGLVGIVTAVGPNYATVRAIIDDSSNVSAMTLSGCDICYVKGSLSQINEGTIKFVDMANNSNEVMKGETIITSNISSKFLPGITIGYVSSVKVDSNNLTRSGTLVPAVDFAHLQEVIVILNLKKDFTDEQSDAIVKEVQEKNGVVTEEVTGEETDSGEGTESTEATENTEAAETVDDGLDEE